MDDEAKSQQIVNLCEQIVSEEERRKLYVKLAENERKRKYSSTSPPTSFPTSDKVCEFFNQKIIKNQKIK